MERSYYHPNPGKSIIEQEIYRPISLTSYFIKLLEKIITLDFYVFLEKYFNQISVWVKKLIQRWFWTMLSPSSSLPWSGKGLWYLEIWHQRILFPAVWDASHEFIQDIYSSRKFRVWLESALSQGFISKGTKQAIYNSLKIHQKEWLDVLKITFDYLVRGILVTARSYTWLNPSWLITLCWHISTSFSLWMVTYKRSRSSG